MEVPRQFSSLAEEENPEDYLDSDFASIYQEMDHSQLGSSC